MNTAGISALLALPVGLFLSLPVGAQTTTIALTGQSAPDGNGQFNTFAAGFPAGPMLNDAGQVVFATTLQNTSGGTTDNKGIYMSSGPSLVKVARDNDIVPGGSGQFESLFDPSYGANLYVLNSAGQVAFYAILKNTSGGTADNLGIFLFSGSTLSTVVRTNATVPDGNGQFSALGNPLLNAAGQVAFAAALKNTSGSTTDDTGVYLSTGASLVKLARAKDAAPGGGTFSGVSTAGLNDVGQVGVTAGLTSGAQGIYRYSTSSQVRIALTTGPAPGGGTFGGGIDYPVINNAGQVAFLGGVDFGSTPGVGEFLSNGTSVLAVAREGDAAPGGGTIFSITYTPPVLNGAGQVAFVPSTAPPGGHSVYNIYLGNGASLINVAPYNAPLPDGNGDFANKDTPALNAAGQVAFSTDLVNTSGGAGVDDRGIYLADSVQQLKVIRLGDVLAGKTVSAVSLSPNDGTPGQVGSGAGGQDGLGDPLNNFAQVTYEATFTDGTSGVFLFTPAVHWRSTAGGNWNTASNWTLSIKPGKPHNVIIDPATSLTVSGPTTAVTVNSLTVGGGAGGAKLVLSSPGQLTATNGVTVDAGATLQLAGSASALATSPNRVNVTNNSQQASGGMLLVSGTHQQVGAIDGTGDTVVNGGSDLTANHIVQNALVIGGAAGSPGLVTIAASDASGNSVGQSSAESSGLDLISSLQPTGPFGAGIDSTRLIDGSVSGGSDFVPNGLSNANSTGAAGLSTVPEPSTLALAGCGLAIATVVGVRRRKRRLKTTDITKTAFNRRLNP